MSLYIDITLNIIDVIVTTTLIYLFLKFLIQSEKMVFIINAIIMLSIFYLITNTLHLNIVNSLLTNVYSWGIVLIFILFPNEIKASLEKIGDIKKKNEYITGNDFIVDITECIFNMADEKIGALITFEATMPLTKYTEKAIKIDADYSYHLLYSIFTKESLIHDGAVIMKGEKIMYASTYFPIELDINIDKKYGTRHRSAISVSRETDALTIIVSEERGVVSIAYKENLYTDLEKEFVIEYLKSKLNNK